MLPTIVRVRTLVLDEPSGAGNSINAAMLARQAPAQAIPAGPPRRAAASDMGIDRDCGACRPRDSRREDRRKGPGVRSHPVTAARMPDKIGTSCAGWPAPWRSRNVPAGPFPAAASRQFGAWLARVAPEIPDLARDEIERERFSARRVADCSSDAPALPEDSRSCAVRGITCCKHPLGEMPKLRLKTAARLIGLAARHETLIGEPCATDERSCRSDVGIVHIGLGHR